ncbi:hypothetical protein GGI05_000550, partial [Coemansia sp. RSA 2603]
MKVNRVLCVSAAVMVATMAVVHAQDAGSQDTSSVTDAVPSGSEGGSSSTDAGSSTGDVSSGG